MKLESTTILEASADCLYSEIGSEAVILDIDSGVYYGLNEIGSQIWQWLQSPKSRSELLELILDEYDVTSERASTDLQNIVQDLSKNGLVKAVNEKAREIS